MKTKSLLKLTICITALFSLSGCDESIYIDWSSSNSTSETEEVSESTSESESTGSESTESESTESSGGSTNEDASAYTIMMYICGSDLESDYSLATEDIKEILKVSGQPDNVNIIIETGGATSWDSTYGISSSKLGRYHVENRSLVQDTQLSNASMGSSSTFQSFLNWGINSYPAEKYGVILWNHGGGIYGVCSDDNYDYDTLLHEEAATALENVFNSNNLTSKLEWIGYDACLMSVAEVADFNSDYFNYMVASEETEPGYGWDYDAWLPTLYADPYVDTETLLAKICDSYVADCADYYTSLSYYYPEYKNGYNDATLAVLDLSKMSAFNTAFETVGGNLYSKITSNTTWRSFETLMNSCQRFGGYEENDGSYSYEYDQFDIGQFITNASDNSTFNVDGLSDLQTALNNLVAYNAYGASYTTAVCGLTMFVAVDGLLVSYGYYTSNDTNYTNWYNLNARFYRS